MKNLTKIDKDNFFIELKKMENLIEVFKIYNPLLYKIFKNVGLLAQLLLKNLTRTNNFVVEDNMDFILASYYSNISYIKLEKFGIFENNHEMFKRHPILSAEMFDINSRIYYLIKNHHEKPNGSGIFKLQTTDKEISCIEIADTFIFNTIDTIYNPAFTKKENIQHFEEQYIFSSIFSNDDISIVSKTLSTYEILD